MCISLNVKEMEIQLSLMVDSSFNHFNNILNYKSKVQQNCTVVQYTS